MRVLQSSVAALLLAVSPALGQGENQLLNASFETPAISGRVEERKGGAPARLEDGTSWAHYRSQDQSGALTVGLTNELARTGKQSLYVDFKNAPRVEDAFLMTDLLPVTGTRTYRISIWGRLDRQRPLTLAESRPLLRVEVEFYSADQENQVGDTDYRTQQIPGSPRRILFETARWNEYFTEVKAPQEAAFMKITFRWQATGEGGTADGVIFFDDAVLVEVPKGSASPTAPATAPAGTLGPTAIPLVPASPGQ